MATQRLLSAILTLAAGILAQPSLASDTVVAAHYPPLMIETDRARPGVAIEILQEAARRADRDIEITFLPFERAIFTLRTDAEVLMPALFQGKKTDDLLHWVVEIDRAELRFASLGPAIDDVETARSLPLIALEHGTTGDSFLQRLGFDNIVRLNDPRSSARMLAAGRVSAWLLTESLMQKVWSDLGESRALTFGDVVHEVPIFLVASQDLSPETSEAYRLAVMSMKEDGTLDEILRKYANH